jgi:hypothetical protein
VGLRQWRSCQPQDRGTSARRRCFPVPGRMKETGHSGDLRLSAAQSSRSQFDTCPTGKAASGRGNLTERWPDLESRESIETNMVWASYEARALSAGAYVAVASRRRQ